MFLEKLVEYARLQLADNLPPIGYQPTAIRYFIEISSDGDYVGYRDTADKEAKRGRSFLAPHVKKTSGVAARLLADNGEYVLGVARDDPQKPPKPERILQQFEAFRDLLHECAISTQDAGAVAVDAFLQRHEAGTTPPDFPADFDPSANISFRIGASKPVMDSEGVRGWWAATCAPESGEEAAEGHMQCIVCGRTGPVLDRHPISFKRIPGARPDGNVLISAEGNAFRSYGLVASKVAPTCPVCAEAYCNALNVLLGDKTTSHRSGELAYAFWTDPKEPTNPFMPVPLLHSPDDVPAQVAALLKAAHTGKHDALFLDPTAFYCVALGASGARVVVKDWIDTTVGRAQEAMAGYFALQEMVDWNGEPGQPVSLQRLARATLRQGTKMTESPPDVVTQSLFRLALKGTPLPDDLLFMAVRRNRAEQSVNRLRATLIRMVLEPKLRKRGEESNLSGLNPERRETAYVCGRLLAVINDIQEEAIPGVNASVVDKYFGSASSNPALVFPFLEKGAQNHLKRLRRDNRKAAVALEARLDDLVSMLDKYPRSLNLESQGDFAIGFHHQRAASRAARIAGGEARRTKEANESEAGEA